METVKYVYASATVIGACFAAVFWLDTNPKQTMMLAILQVLSILLVLCFEQVFKGKP